MSFTNCVGFGLWFCARASGFNNSANALFSPPLGNARQAKETTAHPPIAHVRNSIPQKGGNTVSQRAHILGRRNQEINRQNVRKVYFRKQRVSDNSHRQ